MNELIGLRVLVKGELFVQMSHSDTSLKRVSLALLVRLAECSGKTGVAQNIV